MFIPQKKGYSSNFLAIFPVFAIFSGIVKRLLPPQV
jgi:hypothetical protein